MKVLMEGWRRFLNEEGEGEAAPPPKKNVSYTAVVLYEDQANKLKALVPDGWTPICHHMTLHMGPVKNEELRVLLESEYTLTVEGFKKGDKVCAVKVTLPDALLPYYKGKGTAHITIAINKDKGGQPFHSNDLDWTSALETIDPKLGQVTGKLLEVEQGDVSPAKV